MSHVWHRPACVPLLRSQCPRLQPAKQRHCLSKICCKNHFLISTQRLPRLPAMLLSRCAHAVEWTVAAQHCTACPRICLCSAVAQTVAQTSIAGSASRQRLGEMHKRSPGGDAPRSLT